MSTEQRLVDRGSYSTNERRNSNEVFSESANGERSSEAPSSDPVGSAEYEVANQDQERSACLPQAGVKSSENLIADQDGEATSTIMDTKLMGTTDINQSGSTAFHFGDIVRDVITQSSTKYVSGKQAEQTTGSRSQSPSRSPVSIMLTSANPDCDEKAELTVEVNNPDAVVDRMIKTLAAKFHPESVVTIGCGMGTCNANYQSFSASQQMEGMGSTGYFGGRMGNTAGFSTTASSGGYRVNPSQSVSQTVTQYSNAPSTNYSGLNTGAAYTGMSGLSGMGNSGQYQQVQTVEMNQVPMNQGMSSRIQVNTLPGVLLADTDRSGMKTSTTTSQMQQLQPLALQGVSMNTSPSSYLSQQGFKSKFQPSGNVVESSSSRTEYMTSGSPSARRTSLTINGMATDLNTGRVSMNGYSPSTQFVFGATEGAYSGQALGSILEGHVANARYQAERFMQGGERTTSRLQGNESVVAERFVSSTNIAEEYLTPQMNTNEEQVRYVEVPMVQEVIREVVRKEYVEVEKRVPKIELEYVDRIVEVPEVQWVDKQVEVPRVQEVIREVKTKQYVDRPREVIRTVPKLEIRQVEKLVEVPQIVDRPVPVTVEERVGIAEFTDTEVATVVAQSMTPLVGESGETIELEMTDYEPVLISVEVPIPVPVSITHGAAVRVNTVHNVVNIKADQFNALLRVANEQVIAQYGEQVIPWFTEVGTGSRVMLPLTERIEIVAPVSNEWMSQHVTGQIHVVQQGVVQMEVSKKMSAQVFMNGVCVGSQANAMAQLSSMSAQSQSQATAVMSQARTNMQQVTSGRGLTNMTAGFGNSNWTAGGAFSGNLKSMNYAQGSGGVYSATYGTSTSTTGNATMVNNMNTLVSTLGGSIQPFEATMMMKSSDVQNPAMLSHVAEGAMMNTQMMNTQMSLQSNNNNNIQKLQSVGSAANSLPGVFLGENQQGTSVRANQASFDSKNRN